MPTTDTERMFGDAAALSALPGPSLPWGPGGMRPSDLVLVRDDVVGYGSCLHRVLLAPRQLSAPDATVVVDEVERPGEQAVLRRWQRESGLTFDRGPDGVATAAGMPTFGSVVPPRRPR